MLSSSHPLAFLLYSLVTEADVHMLYLSAPPTEKPILAYLSACFSKQ